MLISWIPTPIGEGWDTDPDPVVWLNVARMEASFQKNADHYVGIGGIGAGQQSRYNRIGRFIQTGHPVYMPHLSMDGDDAVSFTDGRHRFAWVRDHGARAIPVTTYLEIASRLEAIFGTSLRECRVTP
jgi:hypothetical protein